MKTSGTKKYQRHIPSQRLRCKRIRGVNGDNQKALLDGTLPARALSTGPACTSTPSTRPSSMRFTREEQDLYEFREGKLSPVRPRTCALRASGEIPAEGPASTRRKEVLSDPSMTSLHGRRIVNMAYLFKQILADKHNDREECSFMNMEFVNEHKQGFQCMWKFKCKMCQKVTILKSDEEDENLMSVNDAAVSGTLSGGGGYASMSAFCSALNMPCIASNRYVNHERRLQSVLEQVSMEAMLAAGIKERELALQEKRVNAEGTPLISVVADGMWGKRSYRTKYDALSGVALIIGYRTRKVLFIGVRNKYCSVCDLANRRGKPAQPHKCFKNWNGTSTSMEADIISEGFRLSIDMHGLIYHQLIADGDSSVYRTLLETLPYEGTYVEKIECCNHLLRNFSTKIKELKSLKGVPQEFKRLRNTVSDNVLRLRVGITRACRYRHDEDASMAVRIRNLQADIINSPCHIFGDHAKCATYFCGGPKVGEVNLVPSLKEAGGLWGSVMQEVNRLSAHAKSLILLYDNNVCEIVNSILAKLLGGKRVNYSRRSSFQTRCKAAVVLVNTSGYLQSTVQRDMQGGNSPGLFTKKYEAQKTRRKLNLREFRKNNPRVKRRICQGPDKDYGNVSNNANDDNEEPQILDIDPEELEKAKENYLTTLTLTGEERDELQRDTLRQTGSMKWFEERRKRLTASKHGEICKMRPSTSCKKKVHNILYYETRPTKDMQLGMENEATAKEVLFSQYKLLVEPCGLFIDEEYPYLAASPDGLVGEDTVVEIKCPAASAFETLDGALEAKKVTFVKKEGNRYLLKSDHNYYYQVQSQMRMTKRTKCIFFVYTSTWNKILETITYAAEFWKCKMENRLTLWYKEALLPELCRPRYRIRKDVNDIREAPHVINFLKEKEGQILKNSNIPKKEGKKRKPAPRRKGAHNQKLERSSKAGTQDPESESEVELIRRRPVRKLSSSSE